MKFLNNPSTWYLLVSWFLINFLYQVYRFKNRDECSLCWYYELIMLYWWCLLYSVMDRLSTDQFQKAKIGLHRQLTYANFRSHHLSLAATSLKSAWRISFFCVSPLTSFVILFLYFIFRRCSVICLFFYPALNKLDVLYFTYSFTLSLISWSTTSLVQLSETSCLHDWRW